MAGPGVCWALAALSGGHKFGSSTQNGANFQISQQKKARSYGKKTPKEMAEFAIPPCISNSESLFVVCVFLCCFCWTCRCALPIDLLVRLLKKKFEDLLQIAKNHCLRINVLLYRPFKKRCWYGCWSTADLPGSCNEKFGAKRPSIYEIVLHSPSCPAHHTLIHGTSWHSCGASQVATMRLSIIILDSTAWICKALKNLAMGHDVWLKARKIKDSEHGGNNGS